MKLLSKISACALLAAGLVTPAFGQIQIAGSLLVDVDATAQPVGSYSYLTNNGSMGGVFVPTNGLLFGVTNSIVAIGGNGTHGVLLDGYTNSLRHVSSAVGGTNYWLTTAAPGLAGSNPDFSVEAWMYKATINDETGPVAWGNRNVSGANVSCNWGRNTGWGGFSWQGGGYDHGWASVPMPGAWHHLVWTYDAIPFSTNAGTVRLYRDGVLDKAEAQINAPNISPTNSIWLGAQHINLGTFGCAAGILGKVRVHDGVLSDAQVLNNYNYEAAAFTTGTPTGLLTTAPIHRYSFNLPPTNNAIGMTVPDTGSSNGAPAIIRGNSLAPAAAWPYFDGGQLVLPSYGGNVATTNGYIDMPNGMLSSLSTNVGGPGTVSLEVWVEVTVGTTWSEILYMGNAANGEITGTGTTSTGGANGIVIPSNISGNYEQAGFRSASIGNYTVGSRMIGSRKHIVVTWDDTINLAKVYHEGVLVGQFVMNGKMGSIVDVNNWLGRSGWTDLGLVANFREFRMYNRILSPAEIRRNYLVGPFIATDASTITWNGNVDGNWDLGTTYNWLAGGISTNFANGNTVQLDDSATGTTTLNLSTTVAPGNVAAVNFTKNYTIGGTGNLSGPGGLTKNGNATLTFTGPQTNDYTGPTTLLGGTVVVNNLANGGLPSAIGASSSGATNLVFSGGTLSYQGPSTTIDRSFQVSATNSTLDILNSLAISNRVFSAAGSAFNKTGPGTLTYVSPGSNVLSGGPLPGYNLKRGTVVFDGTAGAQTNYNVGEFWVGNPNYGANLLIANATLFSSSWLSVGRGNGSIGNLSTLTLTNGVINITVNGLSMGYDALLPGNLATQVATLNGASAITCAGNANIGESAGSFGTLYLNNNSWLKCVTPRVGLNAGSTGAVYLANSAAITNTAFTSVGASGTGLMVVKDNAVWNSTGDFNVSDVANSVGELVISNNATVLCNGAIWVGKSAGTVGTVKQTGGSFLKTGGNELSIGGLNTASATSVGTWSISGGLLSINGTLFPGSYGQGTFNQSGGTVLANGWTSIGRYAGSVGTFNLTGGLFLATNTTTDVIVGEAGNGTLTISGTGVLACSNRVNIGNVGGGIGTLNLNGGTLVTRRVFMGNAGASSYFNFNGGLLQASPAAAYSDFMSGLSQAMVLVGGAQIDTGTNILTIAQDIYTDSTGGGLTKYGTGSLALTGYLYYNGPTLVSSGLLGLTTHNSGGGSITVADGATLSLQVMDGLGGNTVVSSLTAGNTTGAALNFNLGSFGNPPNAPLDVTGGAATFNGVTTISVDPSSSLSVGEFPLIAYGTKAGAGTLALGTLPPGVFGYLTNDTSGAIKFIGLVVTSVFQPRWEGLAGGTWDIQVTTNWIDVISGLPQFFYQGTKAIFEDSALGTTNVNLVTTVNPGGVLVSNSVLNYNLGGVGRITGGGGLSKVGTGSLVLSTTNNTYTGPTMLDEGGTLITTLPYNLGTNSALSIGTGTLSLGTNNQKFTTVALTNGTIDASSAAISAVAYNLDSGTVNAQLAGGALSTFGANADVVSVNRANTYTGRTYLAGSTLAVTNLANGGVASGIGSSSAGATNLVFAGGGLSYTGPNVAIDRGYLVESGGHLTANGNVTLAGPIVASAGNFQKNGNATAAYTGLGTNVLSRGGLYIGAGTLLLNGGASTPANYLQTNIVVGDVWVGYDQANAGTLIVTNTSLSISTWLALDRGNGVLGSQSVASFYDSAVSVGNFSMGYDNGIVGSSEFPVLNLNGATKLNDAGAFYVGESIGSDAKVYINNTAIATITGSAIIGRNAGATGALQVANSGQLIVNGGSSWLSAGGNGGGSLTLKDTALVMNSRDENIGDVTGSTGALNLQGNATNRTANLYVGKSGTAYGEVNQSGGYLNRFLSGAVTYNDWRIGGATAADTAAVGVYNLSGGAIDLDMNFQIGTYGTGTWNQSGGTVNSSGAYPVVARFAGSTGFMTVSGGSFNQNGSGQLLIIGEDGTGTLTVSGSGLVNSVGGISIGHTVTGIGTINLDGGTLRSTRVYQAGAGASSTFNFNGGVLQASANNATFMTGLGAANVLAGGAVLDSSSNSVTIGQPLLDGGTGGGLTKLGTGIVALGGVNTYTGLTTVSNGTLQINGSIATAVAVKANGTIGGTGTITGNTVVENGGTLAPGASVGTLTMNGNLTLAGNLFIELNKALTPSNDLAVVTGTLNNIGTGIVTVTNLNLGQPLVAGDSFKLFSQPLVGGNALTIVGSLGSGLGWTNHLALDGTIAVIPTLALNRTNLNYSVSGSTLTLSWPADHTGWILQSQTNGLTTGLENNWVDVPGSAASNTNVINVDAASPAVFFRLRTP